MSVVRLRRRKSIDRDSKMKSETKRMQDEMTSGRTSTDIGLNFDNEKFTDIMDKLVRRRAIDKEYL